MKKFTFKSIRTRLTFWFLTLALLPLFIGILITFNSEKRSIEQRTFDKLITIRDLKVQQVQTWRGEKESWIRSTSERKEFRELEQFFQKKELYKSDYQTIENMRNTMKRYLANYDGFFELLIINKYSREVIVSTNSDNEGVNESQDPSLTEFLATEDFFIKDIHLSKFYNVPAMAFAMPIRCIQHNGKHIIGILVARVNLEKSLYALLSNRIGLGETGETLIVNKDVLVLNELRWYDNAPLNLKIESEPAINASEGKTGITKTADYRSELVLAAYTYIPETEWGFVCKQDLYELNAPIRGLINNFVILLFVSTLLVVLIVLSISKTISKPIVDMNIVTQKIKEGDYSARNVVRSEDELGSLADSINKTTDTLESVMTTQKGVMDISETMIGKSSMLKFGSELLKQLMEITKSNMGTFYILNEASSEFEHFTSVGANEELLKSFSSENPEGEFGNALLKKSIYYLRDIPEDTVFKFKTTAGDAIPKEIITIPIMIEDTVVALISLVNIHRFSKECVDIIEQSLLSINTSYSSLMASERTRILAEHLTKTNQQLEAQTEELQEQTEELQSQSEELQQTSEELQEQNMELDLKKTQVEEANRLKSEFLSNMSHELRTPLNSIMALSRVLIMQAKDKLNEEENNYLEIVERNGKQLLALINDILDLSKIEAGKMDVNPKMISLNSMLKNINDSLMPIVWEKDLKFTLNVIDDLPKIETDEAKLHQVLQNIISNAVKFTEKGQVDISTKLDDGNVIVKVKDSGIGIPEDALSHIFDEFRQVDGSSSRQYEGTGLGLAIANKLIKVLGGDIQVKSELDKGSTFTITIPIKWQGEEEGADFKIINPAESKTVIKYNKDISETRLLMVEDNEATIIQVKAVLENEGYQIDIANDGQQALDYVKHTIPDGIILDLMMPNIDGFEVLENIRNTKATKKIPVLILTAKDLTSEDMKKLSANNIQQLIQKGDVDQEGLLFKVKLMLGNAPVTLSERKNKVKVKPKEKKREGANKKKSKSGLPTVLLVEDNLDNITTIKAILKDKASIIEAYDGIEGLKTAQTVLPDLILLDISLPKMDGVEVVTQLKQIGDTKDIPVIAITAHAMKEDRETFLAAGCDDYMSKPVDPKKVIKKVSKWLRKVRG